MTTIDAFVGALLKEIAKGRAISDQASVRLAEAYLKDELLKGFPVPRMQIGELQVDLNFAMAAQARESVLLQDEEVQKNIGHCMRGFLGSLPRDRNFRAYFRNDAALASRWREGLDELIARIERALTRPPTDYRTVFQKLSVSTHNYFCELAPGDLQLPVTALLAKPIRRRADALSMKALIEEYVRGIVAPLTGNGHDVVREEAHDFNILVGAAELQKLDTSMLNKLKITISPADRRWVVSEKDGHKIHILGN